MSLRPDFGTLMCRAGAWAVRNGFEVNENVVDRVVGEVVRVLDAAEQVGAPEREMLWKAFAAHSEQFRRVHHSVRLFELLFVLGAILLAVAAATMFGDVPLRIPLSLVIVASIAFALTGLRLYVPMRLVVTLAVGACVKLSERGTDEDG